MNFKLAFVLVIVLASHHQIHAQNDDDNLRFASNFKFGAATAAYQVEGAWNVDGRLPSIWDDVAHRVPSVIFDQTTGDDAAKSYEYYGEDVKIADILGLDFYRFSISWSRILPTGELNSRNQLGIDYYNRLINMLLEHGIEPMVTMYHWDLPSTLQGIGGWESDMIVEYFKTYADVLFEEFGDRVKNWITVNEIAVFCIQGYGIAGMAPLIANSGVGEYLCSHHALLAHAEAFHLYKEKYFNQFQGRIGITLSSDFYMSRDGNDAELIRDRALQFSLGWYMHPLMKGNYPQIMIDEIGRLSTGEGRPQSRLPVFTAAQVDRVRGTVEFMGLNYYTSQLATFPETVGPNPSWSRDTGLEFSRNPFWDRAESTWLFSVPDGLRGLLNWIKNEYSNVEVWITENGWSDRGAIDDQNRIKYYHDHLKAVQAAKVIDGCNIQGFTFWSMIDNFEWMRGYSERFGLYRVDFNSPTRERTPKASAAFVQKIIKQREPEQLGDCTYTTISETEDENIKFPGDFEFGAATAAYQIEGAWNTDGKGPSIWDTVTQNNPDRISDGSTGNIAANSYELYPKDIELMKELGLDFYRFSISWPRVLPNGELSSRNQAGIDYYHRLIDALLENDVVPFITMYHWDLPQALQDKGGWPDRMVVDYFKIYAELLFDEYGGKVKDWITFNEPSVYCIEGYSIGSMAPLLTDEIWGEREGQYKCVHHTLLAHAEAYHMYKEKFGTSGKIGITLNTGFTFSADGRNADYIRDQSMQFSLGWYMHPLMKGNYPQVMITDISRYSAEEGRTQSRLPTFTAAEIERIKGTTDFMGLNYYSSYLGWVPENPSTQKDSGLGGGVHGCWPRAKSPWLFSVPQGLRGLLNWIKREYDNIDVYITENGWSDDGQLDDTGRITYYREHLREIQTALVVDGCNVKAFTFWSLIDNFEWMKGYTERFGIYHVNMDSPTRDRTPKNSAAFVKKIIAQRLPKDAGDSASIASSSILAVVAIVMYYAKMWFL